jgi:hypothetical protein
VTDIGNRNMVDPAQLNEFLSFAKQTVPAEHYVVVMWNHGNGYSGLLVDETSAPGAMMSLNQFATALNGVGSLDIIAFDMCLMGGYETLTKIAGTASYAVFSESVVPGAGYPYDEIMRAFNSDPGMSSRNAAIMVADKFDASYAGQRPSTTVSAYDLAGFASFEASLNNLAGSLKVNLPSLSSAIASSASHSQAFEVRPIKDLGNLLDSLSARISDGGIATNINAVRAAAGAFRLQHHARNGSDPYASNVSRASGLSIVLPSGVASDRLPASGSGSLGDYRATLGTKPWAEFLTAWAGSQAPLGYTDMGTQRFETYLVWDSAAVSRAADIDMFVLEPDGYLYGPALGSISPSGLFTADSRNTHLYLEGFGMGRYVQTGSYRFYAFLWTDPANYGPAYTVYYRNSPSAEFQSLYSAPYPRLTRGNTILSDPFASFSRIDNGQYTDFRPIAMLTIPPAFASSQLNLDLKAESPGNSVASESFGGVTTNIERLREPTSAQLETLKSLIRKRREGVMKGRLELPSLRNIRPPAEKQD